MTLDELRNVNRVTEGVMAAVRAGAIQANPGKLPYYGYLTVDAFDCPPFIMFTNNDSPVLEYIISDGTFEPCSMALWCALVREATGALDIGANVGIYTLCAAKLRPDLAIHAFEPNPYAYARLRIHKHVNELSNMFEYRAGLAGKEGVFQLTWLVKPNGAISSGAGVGELRFGGTAEHAYAPYTSLDACNIAPTLGVRPVVKMDVEGAECHVIEGAKDLLVLRPDMIIESLEQERCDELNRVLLPLGYAVYGIFEGERVLRRRERLLAPKHIGNLNQLLTVRTTDELRALRPRDVTIAP